MYVYRSILVQYLTAGASCHISSVLIKKIKRNMNTTKFDVSPFLLLEEFADSDGEGTVQINEALDGGESNDGDDKSCSTSLYETSCMTATSQRHSFDPEEEDTVNEERIFTAVEEDDEDGEGEVNSYRRCGISHFVKLSVDSSEVVSEMDKSRMFWEACLAS
ncbi:unnamed protein product [Eruca vesicaria subsp. sativa]|uniref:Uncharacterized protein n=1 Tax=Eruca vesicaria subsp. sativa TaxID=29727 RepID=A0ABC8K2R9_ERUVS|nr:unnamed protein product [Eruca vesicaria subsp. sativa]